MEEGSRYEPIPSSPGGFSRWVTSAISKGRVDDDIPTSAFVASGSPTETKQLAGRAGPNIQPTRRVVTDPNTGVKDEDEDGSDDPINAFQSARKAGMSEKNRKTYGGRDKRLTASTSTVADSSKQAARRDAKLSKDPKGNADGPLKRHHADGPSAPKRTKKSSSSRMEYTDPSDVEEVTPPTSSQPKPFPMRTKTEKSIAEFPMQGLEPISNSPSMLPKGKSLKRETSKVAPFPMTGSTMPSPPTNSHRASSTFEGHRSKSSLVSSDTEAAESSPGPSALSRKPSKARRPPLDTPRRRTLKSQDTLDSAHPPTPSKLCPFCDEPLPRDPSSKLRKLLESMKSQTRLAPRTTNALGRDAPLQLSIIFCMAHRDESTIIPEGRAKGWPGPSDIKFHLIRKRMEDPRIKSKLKALVDTEDPSTRGPFWDAACEDIETRGARIANSVQGQMETFTLTQPGYYGEQGYFAICSALQSMFPPESIERSSVEPLDIDSFIRRVLLPETAILLIMEDMEVDRDGALDIMEESRAYGQAVFPLRDQDGDTTMGDVSLGGSTPVKVSSSKGKGRETAGPSLGIRKPTMRKKKTARSRGSSEQEVMKILDSTESESATESIDTSDNQPLSAMLPSTVKSRKTNRGSTSKTTPVADLFFRTKNTEFEATPKAKRKTKGSEFKDDGKKKTLISALEDDDDEPREKGVRDRPFMGLSLEEDSDSDLDDAGLFGTDAKKTSAGPSRTNYNPVVISSKQRPKPTAGTTPSKAKSTVSVVIIRHPLSPKMKEIRRSEVAEGPIDAQPLLGADGILAKPKRNRSQADDNDDESRPLKQKVKAKTVVQKTTYNWLLSSDDED